MVILLIEAVEGWRLRGLYSEALDPWFSSPDLSMRFAAFIKIESAKLVIGASLALDSVCFDVSESVLAGSGVLK